MKKENTYVMNLEAAYIYKDFVEGKDTSSKKRDYIKLFSATIPYSIETIRIDNMFPDTFYLKNRKQYTKKIVNITFDKNYSIWNEEENKRKIIANKNKIRKHIYSNGFTLDDIKYVFYKRGSGKAKNGYALFIQEHMKQPLLYKSRVGLVFEENEELDLTSLLAYESLISSSIDFTINLDPKTEILLIDDIYGLEFDSIASVTTEKDRNLTTQNETIKLQNCLTDGQGILDESVFAEYEKTDKGFMLLRNDMFKCCAFNTKLQKWFKYHNLEFVEDMFGNTYETSKIKLVTTPNSLKFLKFAYKVGEGTHKECYKYWINNVDDIFGVVKCDKDTNYGNYNRTTYQLINSIPNLTYDDLMQITEVEREYAYLLKNDEAVFRNYLGCDAKASLKLERHLEEGDLSLYENTDLMNALLLVNSDIKYTKKFKKMKSDLISNYINNLKSGRIRLKDSKYVTLVSNPYEMLLASIDKYCGKSIMSGREIYCNYYKDGQEFCAMRNPHVNSGNVMSTINKYHNEYDEWFNLTDNICVINFFDNDAPDRLQGCDTDSDQVLLIPNEILSEKAKYCEKNFTTPINRVKGKSKPKKNNMKELQKLDAILSNNYIGKIINTSQIINSYMNDSIHKGYAEEIIQDLYHVSSRLSSMSQIEIDKSKKVFDNVSMSKELSRIRKIKHIRYVQGQDKYNKDKLVDMMVVPEFFKFISDFNEYRVFEKFHTPLDILQDVLIFEGGKRSRGDKNLELIDLLVSVNSLDGEYQTRTIHSIYVTIEECGKKINGLKLKTNTLNEKAKITIERKLKREAMEKLKKINPSEVTVLNILKQCFGEKEKDKNGFKKYGMLTLNLLFITKKVQVLKCFKSKDMDFDEVLIKLKDKYDYDLFGEKYQKVKRKDLI